MPSVMKVSDRKRLDRLARLHGHAFDTAFIQEARRVNDDNMRSLRKEASRTVDPDIRRFVDRLLQVDEQHKAGAQALSGRDVASRGPVIKPSRTGDTMRVDPPQGDNAMPVIPPAAAPPK